MFYGILVIIDYIFLLEIFSIGFIKFMYEMVDVVVLYFVFKFWDCFVFEYVIKSLFVVYVFKIEDFIVIVILWYEKIWSFFLRWVVRWEIWVLFFCVVK